MLYFSVHVSHTKKKKEKKRICDQINTTESISFGSYRHLCLAKAGSLHQLSFCHYDSLSQSHSQLKVYLLPASGQAGVMNMM